MKQFDLQGNEYDIQIEEMLYSIPKDVKSVYFRFTEKDLLEGFREEALRHREEIERLHSIIKEVREYIKDNCILSDTWEELENHQFIPTGRINYKSLNGKKIKELLGILDKENKE